MYELQSSDPDDQRQERMRQLVHVIIDMFSAGWQHRRRPHEDTEYSDVVVYLRVSSDEQARDAYGLESYRRLAASFGTKRGEKIRSLRI